MNKFAIIAIASLLFLGLSGQSMAGVDISVNIPPPPAFSFPGLPELVLIPGTYVYYDPYVDINLFFYDGAWYRHYDGYWYRSVNYEGPWFYIGSPPPVLINLPPNYRIITREYRPIPWWEVRSHWRDWQRERFWSRHRWDNYWQAHRVSAPPSWARHNWQERQNWRAENRARFEGRAQENRARIEGQRDLGQQQRDRLRERQDMRTQQNRARIEERGQQNRARVEEQRNRAQQQRENLREREHGLAPSYRGGEQPRNSAGTIRPRNESRGGAARQNQGAATHENGGGAARGGARHERH